jgi:hypothetical protein
VKTPKKPIDDLLDIAVDIAVKESGKSQDEIEQVSSYMITYINTGAKYGTTPEGFYRWFTEQGGKL